MYFKNMGDIFRYPHLKSLLKHYLWKNPSLLLASSNLFSNYYFTRKVQELTGENLISSVDLLLPEKLTDHFRQNNFKEFDGFRILLYFLIRKYKPEIVIETGVSTGASTSFILAALHENNKGTLYSIDLPPKQADIKENESKTVTLQDGAVYSDKHITGKLIPEYLKYRWNLILGDSASELPDLLERTGKCSIFFHDSLHTYDHMLMEYGVAWPFIESGGFLVSHDVIWNSAFSDFTKKVGKKPLIYNSLGLIQK